MSTDESHDTLLPDFHYETYWSGDIGIKDFIKRIAGLYSHMKHYGKLTDELSEQLNRLQKKGRFCEIISTIESFLEDFFWKCLLTSRYDIRLSHTHLKRWIACCRDSEDEMQHDTLANPWIRHLCFLYDVCKPQKATSYLPAMQVWVQINERDISVHLKELLARHHPAIMFSLLKWYPNKTHDLAAALYGTVLPVGIKSGEKACRMIAEHRAEMKLST